MRSFEFDKQEEQGLTCMRVVFFLRMLVTGRRREGSGLTKAPLNITKWPHRLLSINYLENTGRTLQMR